MIISIDPGLNHCGLALWTDDGKLLRAWLARSKTTTKDDIATRWRGVVRAVGTGGVSTVVVEGQQVYRGGKKGANPNDLLELAAVLGGLAMAFASSRVVRYLPREWTHGANHDVVVERLESTLSHTEKGRIERKPAYLAHNVEDAVALGLYHFGRLWPASPRPARRA